MVTISCKHSMANIAKAFVHWSSLTLEVPTAVVYDDDDRLSGVSGQLSGSIDSSSSSASLTITDLQIEDEADYYCQSSGSGFSHSAQNQGWGETRSPRKTGCEIIVLWDLVEPLFG